MYIETDKIILKFIWKYKGVRIAKSTLKGEAKTLTHHPLLYYKTTTIRWCNFALKANSKLKEGEKILNIRTEINREEINKRGENKKTKFGFQKGQKKFLTNL